MSDDRLRPDNEGNARLLYIDGDKGPCDICDEIDVMAVFETIGGAPNSTCINICKKCIKETAERFDEGE